MKDPRPVRTKAIWLLVLPFLWFAAPSVEVLVGGAVLAVVGLIIRGWAAGTIQKDRTLTTTGPYAYTRNPLYVGSFFIGTGVALAGGHWAWPLLFLAFYVTVYGRTLAFESEVLTELFGDSFREYAASVPAVVPRLTPYRAGDQAGSGGFTWAQYRRHNEWEALLGVVAAFLILAGKGWLFG